MALGAPSRDRCRLKYAPNALFELNNVSAAMRSADAARLATGLVALLSTLPPLILEPGQRPSQEVKCLTVFQRFISVPISAMILSAVFVLMPLMLERSTPDI